MSRTALPDTPGRIDQRLLADRTPEGEVYRAIRSAARKGDRAPSDWMLADLLGLSTHSARAVVARLAHQGALQVERTGNARAFVLPGISARTDFNGPRQPAPGEQSENSFRRARLEARLAARQPDPAPVPDRTPCFHCGTRADFGCRHRRML